MAPAYIWGDALSVLQQVKLTASLVNLETSVTVSDDVWRGDLGAMYFATITPQDDRLAALRVVPMHMQRLRLTRPAQANDFLTNGPSRS